MLSTDRWYFTHGNIMDTGYINAMEYVGSFKEIHPHTAWVLGYHEYEIYNDMDLFKDASAEPIATVRIDASLDVQETMYALLKELGKIFGTVWLSVTTMK